MYFHSFLNFVCRSSTTKIVSICVQFISTQIKVIIQIFLNFSLVLHLYYLFTTSKSCSKFERITHRLIININFHSIDSFIRLHSEIPMRHIHHNLHYASSLRPFVHLKLCIWHMWHMTYDICHICDICDIWHMWVT